MGLLKDAPAVTEWKPEVWRAPVCVCVRVSARARVYCGERGKLDICCAGGQAASHPPASRYPSHQFSQGTTSPDLNPAFRSGVSDLVTHSFNNLLRTCYVPDIILGPGDTAMNGMHKNPWLHGIHFPLGWVEGN